MIMAQSTGSCFKFAVSRAVMLQGPGKNRELVEKLAYKSTANILDILTNVTA